MFSWNGGKSEAARRNAEGEAAVGSDRGGGRSLPEGPGDDSEKWLRSLFSFPGGCDPLSVGRIICCANYLEELLSQRKRLHVRQMIHLSFLQ
ncbi:hypothetical protein CEXT_575961 [Caerostris extrusa]|uniref:Uncharacterized protein n=1 Tax=Caerostris extrusa TaxID=172846 RepID=A0AAV4WCH5_CAEEX|nr:hypothetical protein CEXT_575961 [Caerostris extrusa]